MCRHVWVSISLVCLFLSIYLSFFCSPAPVCVSFSNSLFLLLSLFLFLPISMSLVHFNCPPALSASFLSLCGCLCPSEPFLFLSPSLCLSLSSLLFLSVLSVSVSQPLAVCVSPALSFFLGELVEDPLSLTFCDSPQHFMKPLQRFLKPQDMETIFVNMEVSGQVPRPLCLFPRR